MRINGTKSCFNMIDRLHHFNALCDFKPEMRKQEEYITCPVSLTSAFFPDVMNVSELLRDDRGVYFLLCITFLLLEIGCFVHVSKRSKV